jgi:RNA polymerase sigma-70 factor (ECF subfamily)
MLAINQSDFQLIDLAINGDDRAFKLLVERHQKTVATASMNMVGDMDIAQEIGQQTFIRFYKAMHSFKKEAKLSTYLTRIAINLSLNHLKRKKSFANRSLSLNTADKVQTATDTFDNKQVVNMALQMLNDKHRSVVILRMIQGYSTDETATILDIPKGTVLSRLKRGLEKLKKHLKEDLDYAKN